MSGRRGRKVGGVDGPGSSTRSTSTRSQSSATAAVIVRPTLVIDISDSSDEEVPPRPTIAESESEVFRAGQVSISNEFAVTGRLDNSPLLVIHIQGFGPLTFPVYSETVIESLRPFMEKSDYSVDLGKKRIFDQNIRLSSEIPPSRLKIMNPHWEKYLVEILLPKIGGELDFDHSTTRVDLQKLLIYEKGSFFSAHSDRVRCNGHFGTLIVQLPSRYSGGQLKCRYEGRADKIFDHSSPEEVTNGGGLESVEVGNEAEEAMDVIENVNFAEPFSGNEFSVFYTAFYLGVEHEVAKVNSGFRTCLVYSLIDTKGHLAPEIVDNPPKKKKKSPPRKQLATKARSKLHGPRPAQSSRYRPGTLLLD